VVKLDQLTVFDTSEMLNNGSLESRQWRRRRLVSPFCGPGMGQNQVAKRMRGEELSVALGVFGVSDAACSTRCSFSG
jgi:hypothetical protein